MNNRFSNRVLGFDSGPSLVIQKDFMNDELKNSLWNVISQVFISNRRFGSFGIKRDHFHKFYQTFFMFYLRKPVDEIYGDFGLDSMRFKDTYFKLSWYEIYDLIEFIVGYIEDQSFKSEVKEVFNNMLEMENSAYRFIDNVLSEIISEQEIEEIERAVSHVDKFSSVKEHLSRSLVLMSDRSNPDFRNSIKESISSVESLVSIVVGKNDSLGKLIKKLDASKNIPDVMKEAYSKLYGYTSSQDGIRHAIFNKSELTYADARYMLVVCSAFVNYVIEVNE